jgi:hypothetical protein
MMSARQSVSQCSVAQEAGASVEEEYCVAGTSERPLALPGRAAGHEQPGCLLKIFSKSSYSHQDDTRDAYAH